MGVHSTSINLCDNLRFCGTENKIFSICQHIGLGNDHGVAVICIGESAFHDQIAAAGQLCAVQLQIVLIVSQLVDVGIDIGSIAALYQLHSAGIGICQFFISRNAVCSQSEVDFRRCAFCILAHNAAIHLGGRNRHFSGEGYCTISIQKCIGLGNSQDGIICRVIEITLKYNDIAGLQGLGINECPELHIVEAIVRLIDNILSNISIIRGLAITDHLDAGCIKGFITSTVRRIICYHLEIHITLIPAMAVQLNH